MSFYFAQLLTGLANAASLFLIASGLSVIFGVTRVVNFAHGSLYMLGAYLACTFSVWLGFGFIGFFTALLLAAIIVACCGAVMEITVLRPTYRAPELFQLLATFGVLLVIQDITLWVWGPEDLLGPRAPALDSAVHIWGEIIPEYDLALIAAAAVVIVALHVVLYRTRWGILVRAASEDREMVGALGVNQKRLFTSAFMLGAFLAGLGGALQIPRTAISLQMDLNIIVEAFVVVVVGGMGSVVGALVAAILISVLNAFGILLAPQIPLILPFIVMAAVLILRPQGLFGEPEPAPLPQSLAHTPPLRPLTAQATWLLWAAIAGLVLLPTFSNPYALVLLIDVFIASLFAASLHFLIGLGGMISFGHAAYFGLGAYAAALLIQTLHLAMWQALLLAPAFGALGALLLGWFCVRLSGVYMAMLTLAAAQILWGVVFQWQGVTGGDDGILGVWPPGWLGGKKGYFYLALALCMGTIGLLNRIAHSPFGYVLRGGRDSPQRIEAIGLDLRAYRWGGFIVAGACAGLAGGLFAFAKGSVFPDVLAVAQSVDGLIMVLLGGVQTLSGPILGAGTFVLIEDWVAHFPYWRLIFGSLIILLVIAAPHGITGALQSLKTILRARQ